MSELIIKGQKAKEASYVLMNATTTKKNNDLLNDFLYHYNYNIFL